MSKIYIIFCFVLLSCDSSPNIKYRNKCTYDTGYREWTLECIKNGNPMSDEEGEDLVLQCEESAKSLFVSHCEPEKYCENKNFEEIPISECEKI